MSMFKKATKTQAKLRMAVHGPSGAGKTYSALRIGSALGKRIALIDTERGSASKYSDKFAFDVCELHDDYNPQRLFEALRGAGDAGFDVVIVDSLTHFWNGPGGFLELVDEEVKKQKARGHKPDSFAAWKSVDALYRRLIQAILATPFHFIGTLRAKTEYEKVEGSNGKTQVKKVGMAPEMRGGFEYEFDVEGMLDIEHNFAIGKTRCDALDGKVFTKPGEDVAKILLGWLNDGAAAPPVTPVPASASAPAAPASEPRPAASTTEPDALDAHLAALIEASPETIVALKDAAKKALKGAALAKYQAAYQARYRELHPPTQVAS